MGRIDFELLPLTGGGHVTKDYVYDALGRVGSIAHFVDGDADRQYDSGTETLFDKFDYSYFADGSRASETRTNADGTTTVEWTYDGLNRLIEEQFVGFDGQGDPLSYVDTYSFDLSSNRTKLVHDDQTSGGGGSAGPDSTTTYEYDANDRLLAETKDVAGSTAEDRHTVYGYGPTDQTSKTVHEGLDDQGAIAQDIDFLYDATGRMTGVTMAVGSTTTTVTYRYDHSGFRVEATVDDGTNPPVTTIFHVDPNNPTGYIQVVEEGVDADGDGRLDASEIEKAFVLGMDVLSQATASAIQHLLYDAHGTTKAILDAATSSVVERYVYSAYGIDLGLASGPLSSLRYAGEYIDPISGLSFNRARWYDPSSGRWNRLDPWLGDAHGPLSLHKYLYGHGSPTVHVDPSGYMSYTELLVVMGLMALLVSYLLPALRGALEQAHVVTAAGNRQNIFTATFMGDATWEDWKRVTYGFLNGGAAGSLNILDQLTFQAITPLHEYRNQMWEAEGLNDTWVGTASNASAIIGTHLLYSAAILWAVTPAGMPQMSVAISFTRQPPKFIHFEYGLNGVWRQAVAGWHITATGRGHIVITGIPVRYPIEMMVNEPNYTRNCFTAVIRAIARAYGWA